uniref:DUF2192 domain-containing protein n=1 Tax=Fervidicoccus fontis TaxID=683846 RepID=A0A7J3ZJI7_9CREN
MSRGIREKSPYKEKVSIAVDIIAAIIEKNLRERKKAIEILKSKYESARISPFRGVALPEDIYDKEMATLYVVGKYGMGIDQDYPGLFNSVFDKEQKYERAVATLLEDGLSSSEKREGVTQLLGEITGNELARMFRLVFTKIVLGFGEESELVKTLRKAREVFPEFEREIKNYAKFYIGFKLAERICTGEIRDRVEKEAEKQALNLSFGLGRTMPDDDYVYNIARNVFRVPKSLALRVLSINEEGRKSGSKSEKAGSSNR